MDNESNPSRAPASPWQELLLLALTVVTAAWLFSRPSWPQSLAYHDFADQRTMFGVPHFANVVSNVPFLLVGLCGVWTVLFNPTAFRSPVERWPYLCFFTGVALTTFGSAYYHLDPTSERLLWDRLPMGLAFMGLFDAVITERVGLQAGKVLLVPLIVLGIGSVLYWNYTDDLRLYYLVQFYPVLAMPLMLLLFSPRYTGTGWLFNALGFYVLAKFCEHPFDATIYLALGESLSGHTLKHLLAAVAVWCIFHMLRSRRPLDVPSG